MATRRLAGGLIFTLALNMAAAAEPPATVILGTPPQPSWAQLTPQQRQTLAPLAKDWDALENIRRKKWLGIAARYPNMKLDDQLRMQKRMREWAALSPSERDKVRDSYKDFQQLPADQKHAVRQKWEAYSSLPPDERQQVRESGKSSRLLNSGKQSPVSPPVSSGTPQ